MKRILLIGAGHAHLAVLRSLVQRPLYGARITLVSPQPRQIYSGMLPGFIAEHYRLDEIEADVAGLAARAYAEFVEGAVTGLDLPGRRLHLAGGEALAYDYLSVNAGSAVDLSIPGSSEHALAVKPFGGFLAGLNAMRPARVAIAGAGAAGIELAMALRHRGAEVALFSHVPTLSAVLAGRATPQLRALGVDFRPGRPIDAIEPGPVVIAGSARQDFDAVLLATGAVPLAWLRDSGLASDERGFVLVDEMLRSTSHPEVFAAGDCASLRGAPHPKSGVYSVRHGETLAANLRCLVEETQLQPYRPQARALVLLSCGRKYAIAEWGGWSAQGAWAWRWKDAIDRRWLRSLAA